MYRHPPPPALRGSSLRPNRSFSFSTAPPPPPPLTKSVANHHRSEPGFCKGTISFFRLAPKFSPRKFFLAIWGAYNQGQWLCAVSNLGATRNSGKCVDLRKLDL